MAPGRAYLVAVAVGKANLVGVAVGTTDVGVRVGRVVGVVVGRKGVGVSVGRVVAVAVGQTVAVGTGIDVAVEPGNGVEVGGFVSGLVAVGSAAGDAVHDIRNPIVIGMIIIHLIPTKSFDVGEEPKFFRSFIDSISIGTIFDLIILP